MHPTRESFVKIHNLLQQCLSGFGGLWWNTFPWNGLGSCSPPAPGATWFGPWAPISFAATSASCHGSDALCCSQESLTILCPQKGATRRFSSSVIYQASRAHILNKHSWWWESCHVMSLYWNPRTQTQAFPGTPEVSLFLATFCAGMLEFWNCDHDHLELSLSGLKHVHTPYQHGHHHQILNHISHSATTIILHHSKSFLGRLHYRCNVYKQKVWSQSNNLINSFSIIKRKVLQSTDMVHKPKSHKDQNVATTLKTRFL